jgi:hypothetical protein
MEKRGSKAAVNTHPKYLQFLQQNYTKYASLSKGNAVSVDCTAECQNRGKA